jgi:hypothetical protein
VKGKYIRAALVPCLVAVTAAGLALLPAQALGQSCSGGYCGSGRGDTGDTKEPVQVTISISPQGSGVVFVNDTEPDSGVFTALSGDILVLEAVSNSGYVFDRWTDWFDESDSRVEAPVYNHKTLTAHFVEAAAPSPPRMQNTNTGIVRIPEGTMALGPTGSKLDGVSVELRQPRALPSNGILLGDVYDLKPDGATFDPPIQISLPYDAITLPSGVDEQSLRVAVFDPTAQDWTVLPSEVNTDGRLVVAKVSHFSEFAVVAEGQVVSVPLITPGFSFSSLTILPATPYVGQPATVSVDASYVGSNAQAHTRVVASLDGEIVDEKEIVLSPGDHVTVTLTVRAPQEGTFDVVVNGLTESIIVSGTSPAPALNEALTQAVALAEQDESGPPSVTSSSPFSWWRPVAYVVGAIVMLLLIGPLVRAIWRRTLRYRYDL